MNDQRSLTDQLTDLAAIADREGLYDAADYVRRTLDRQPRTGDLSDGARFLDFMRSIKHALEAMPDGVCDLEIGIRRGDDTSWVIYGARENQNVGEHERLRGSGDVRVRFVRGVPEVNCMLCLTQVDIVPRG